MKLFLGPDTKLLIQVAAPALDLDEDDFRQQHAENEEQYLQRLTLRCATVARKVDNDYLASKNGQERDGRGEKGIEDVGDQIHGRVGSWSSWRRRRGCKASENLSEELGLARWSDTKHLSNYGIFYCLRRLSVFDDNGENIAGADVTKREKSGSQASGSSRTPRKDGEAGVEVTPTGDKAIGVDSRWSGAALILGMSVR